MTALIRVGTSGWAYSGWKGKFYPADLPSSQYLDFYAKKFPATEVNYSFYHLPKVSTYQKWADQAPKDFLFALKASRFISHTKRLLTVEEAWENFIKNASGLGPQLGPILFQFPASFRLDKERLDNFLAMVQEQWQPQKKLRLVFEFRHSSWFVDPVYELLSNYEAALCIADSPSYPRKDIITTKFTYYRFHGRNKLFASSYSQTELKQEALKMKKLRQKGTDIYAFFNNDAEGHAVNNAKTLINLLGLESSKQK